MRKELPKRILLSLLGISSSLLVSCASVPDVPACVEVNVDRGYCVYTVKENEFWIDEVNKFEDKTWWELKPTMILLPASSWAKLKSFVLKTCKERGGCTDNIGEWAENFESRLGIVP